MALVLATACGGKPPTTPTPPPPPTPVVNTVPVIKSVTVSATRTEVARDVDVSAEVQDAETALDKLTYQWTATAGSFTGTGANVKWRLAQGEVATPLDVTITLTVIEQYQDLDANFNPITRENRVTREGTPFRVHDSTAELTKMTISFLVDYFGNSSVSPDACLVDFSDNCPGKEAEREDIIRNRELFVILSAEARVTQVTFNGEMTTAEVLAPCTFRDREIANGREGTSTGDCYMTAVYETNRWWLCSSSFLNGARLEPLFELFRRTSRRGGF